MPFARVMKYLTLALALFLPLEDGHAKKMYRVVDENGNVYFSDKVPPEQIRNERETLNKNARVLEVVEKAKTPEQLLQQKKLDALRKEQEKIVAKQVADDTLLLTTFHSIEDMGNHFEKKCEAFDLERKAIEGSIARLEKQLHDQELQAAGFERNGRKIPEKLLTDIAAIKQQIEAKKQELEQHSLKKQKFEKEFKAEMARFQFLTQTNVEVDGDSRKATEDAGTNSSLGIFVCEDAVQCEKAWPIAGDFVAKFSTTGKNVENDKLIMRAVPANDDDVSLSVSRQENRSGRQQLFLDVQCRKTSLGEEKCASQQVQSLREKFAEFVRSGLASQQ